VTILAGRGRGLDYRIFVFRHLLHLYFQNC
jgi:hypothetical protein